MIEHVLRDIELPDGGTKSFIIHKFDAISGREIVTQYPTSGLPKLGDYKTNEDIMFKMMCFVKVKTGDTEVTLNSRDLVNNHVPDWETLMRLEAALMEYNCSFFRNGKISNFLGDLAEKAPELILSMLTTLSEQLLPKNTPPSEN